MPGSLMSPTRRVPRRGVSRTDQVLALAAAATLLASAALTAWTLWLAGQLAGLATHLTWPDSYPADSPGIAVRLMGHPGDPAAAWPAPARADIPGPVAVYLCWLVVLTAHLAVLLTIVVRVWRRLARRRGFATRSALTDTFGATAVLASIDRMRPSLVITDHDDENTRAAKTRRRRDPLEVARSLGVDAQAGVGVYSPIEMSEAVVAGPRTGKTARVIISRVLDARGPVLATSTRLDVAEPTFDIRAALGPTFVFEPQGLVPGVPRLRWSPIHGCEDRLIAILRGKAFAAGAGVGGANVENGEFFEGEAAAVLRAMLHAAALDGSVTMTDVAAWAANPGNQKPERILRAHGVTDWAETLTAYRESLAGTSNTARVTKSVVSRALDCFADPRVLDACSPRAGDHFDPDTWLADNGTLYLVGARDAQASVAPLLVAMIEDLVFRAKQRGLVTPGGRCDPPLQLILDEVANIAPIPSLPSLMSEGGGSGVPITIAAQSLHQLEDRWGREGGAALAAAANVRVTFGGTNDVDALRDLQALMGKVDEVTGGHSYGGGRTTINEQVRREDLVSIADLRTLADGHAIVVAGRLEPFEVRIPGWWQRHDAAELLAAQKTFQARLTKGRP